MTRVKLIMPDGAHIEALRIAPVGPRRGGVVLIQEIFGLTEHIEEQCTIFAQNGFEVLAPALFDRERPGLKLGYSDIAEAISVLKSHPFTLSLSDAEKSVDLLTPSGPVFMVGYCYGGSITYASACRLSGLTAASCYYGGMLPTLAESAPLCPTLVHLGRDDKEIPAQMVKTKLDRHATVKTCVYPAGHGFNSDRRADYDGPSARDALDRTLTLFKSECDQVPTRSRRALSHSASPVFTPPSEYGPGTEEIPT
jgi:carboxymethylenebutenolidase